MVKKSRVMAARRYNEKNYKLLTMQVPKKEFEELNKIIKKTKMSRTSFFLQAVKEKLERDGYTAKKRYELLCDDVIIFSSDNLEDAEKRLIYETEKMGHNGHYEIVENEMW